MDIFFSFPETANMKTRPKNYTSFTTDPPLPLISINLITLVFYVMNLIFAWEIILLFIFSFCPSLEEVPEFRETFHSRSLYPGSSLNLKCSSRGSPLPQIRWYRYDVLLDHDPLSNIHHRIRGGNGAGTGYRIADYVDEEGSIISHLNVSSITIEDGGLYSCEAVNEVSSKKHTALIQVFGPPLIHSMGNKSVVSSGKFHLDCPVSGFPIQEIHWKKG